MMDIMHSPRPRESELRYLVVEIGSPQIEQVFDYTPEELEHAAEWRRSSAGRLSVVLSTRERDGDLLTYNFDPKSDVVIFPDGSRAIVPEVKNP